MPPEPSIAVIVIAHERAELLRRCLDSLRQQTYRHFDVLVVLNGANEATTQVAHEVAATEPRTRAISIAPVSASLARNQGVRQTDASVLYFLDDDVTAPDHVLAKLAELYTEHGDLAIVGGPNLTPPDDPPFAHLTGAVLGSPWGTGITHARYVVHEQGPARERDLILCNLAVARSVFDSGISFPELFGGEENVLAGWVEERGMRMWYAPELWVYHHRRTTMAGYVSQIYRYGWGRANAMVTSPNNAHPLYFLPVAFLAYLVTMPLLVLLDARCALGLLPYGLGTLVASGAAAARARKARWFPGLLVLFPVTHIAYASGLAWQLAGWWLGALGRRVRSLLWA